MENFLKPNSGPKTPEPAVFSFSDYAAGAGEKLHVSTFEEGLRYRQNRQRPHRHDFYQIFWMRQGAPSFNIDFYHFPVEAHALVFVPPGAVHNFGEMNSSEGFILSFQEDFLEAEGHSVDLFAECPALDPAQIRTVLAVPETSAEIVHDLLHPDVRRTQRETRRIQNRHRGALAPAVCRNSTLSVQSVRSQFFSQIFVVNRAVPAHPERPALPADDGV